MSMEKVHSSEIARYFDIQKESEQKYGENTIVLMEMGGFYEIFGYDVNYCRSEDARKDKNGKIWNESIGLAEKMSVILNCSLAQTDNKKPYGIKNPHKLGFPTISYDKNKNTLLANDFTVVRVDQKQSVNAKGKKDRYIAEICSPTMNMESISPIRTTSNIACIYIEYQKGNSRDMSKVKYDNFLITTGVSVIDIITGSNIVTEYYSKKEDEVLPVQELYRFLLSHSPREIILHLNDMPDELAQECEKNSYYKYLQTVLDLDKFDRLVSHVNKIPQEYRKLSYQTEFFNTVFCHGKQKVNGVVHNVNNKIIEYLGLENYNFGRLAYMLLLQHCHSYNPEIISNLSKPNLEWFQSDKHLILEHNALLQLDIFPQNSGRMKKDTKIDSLLSVIDGNKTQSGRRFLQNLLRNPMCDILSIRTYYEATKEMMEIDISGEPLWFFLEKQLQTISDIGRLQRKLEIKVITPKDLSNLYLSYVKIIRIYVTILGVKAPTLHKNLLQKDDIQNFNHFISRYGSMFDFEKLDLCSFGVAYNPDRKIIMFPSCPVRPGLYPEIDFYANKLESAESELNKIVDHLNTFITGKGKKIELENVDKSKKKGPQKKELNCTILKTSNAQASKIKSSPVNQNLCGKIDVSDYTTSDKIIISDKINFLTSEIDASRIWLSTKLYELFNIVVDEMTAKYSFHVSVSTLIAKIDLIHSYAKISFRNKYCCPTIIDPTSDDQSSFISAKDIRHPIIEKIIDGAYITNDISIGPSNSISEEMSNGLLLYGVNMSGKSSLIKGLAINVIMAQIGCFTPSNLTYRPYSKIITRLSGEDNLFKGESSFIKEMVELRSILRHSDNKTLVIGDEISRGTESKSANGITGSTVNFLVKSSASFILATHLHDLIDLPQIKSLDKRLLKICHLSVIKDNKTNELIYHRRLRDGNGSHIYGILVAETLGMPQDFIDMAYEITNHLIGLNQEIVNTKTSRYNSDVYLTGCILCGKSWKQANLNSHHIIEQNKAVDNIVSKITYSELVGKMHKNAKDNLAVICVDCHKNLHNTGKELETVETINGKIIRLKPSDHPII